MIGEKRNREREREIKRNRYKKKERKTESEKKRDPKSRDLHKNKDSLRSFCKKIDDPPVVRMTQHIDREKKRERKR